jgi:hypothetical protein
MVLAGAISDEPMRIAARQASPATALPKSEAYSRAAADIAATFSIGTFGSSASWLGLTT